MHMQVMLMQTAVQEINSDSSTQLLQLLPPQQRIVDDYKNI